MLMPTNEWLWNHILLISNRFLTISSKISIELFLMLVLKVHLDTIYSLKIFIFQQHSINICAKPSLEIEPAYTAVVHKCTTDFTMVPIASAAMFHVFETFFSSIMLFSSTFKYHASFNIAVIHTSRYCMV